MDKRNPPWPRRILNSLEESTMAKRDPPPHHPHLHHPHQVCPLILGTPENARVLAPIHPFLGPQEGRGGVTTSDFVPFYWGPPRRQGLSSHS